jgi:hypothetical protein
VCPCGPLAYSNGLSQLSYVGLFCRYDCNIVSVGHTRESVFPWFNSDPRKNVIMSNEDRVQGYGEQYCAQ